MSTNHSSEQVPVAVYLRCSSPQQELSVADQRREVTAYCQGRGYRVVREYVDEGKSASKDTEKRVAFKQMIADSAAGGFRVTVCYDAARFTRMDNIEGSAAKMILRSNGVMLDTVKEGTFDWHDPAGRWKDMAFCEANKAASLNISRDSIRGRVNVCGLGYWPCGTVPYGFDRQYTDGVRTVEVKRHERFMKGRNWHLRLVVNDAEAEVVREVFDLFANRGWSMRQVALHLNGRGVPAPQRIGGGGGDVWDAPNIKTILTDVAYKGSARIGGRGSRKTAHNRVAATERPGACPAIVEAHVWHAAQEMLRQRREAKSKPQTARCGVLSGFLFCGHCGYRLVKKARPGARVRYVCESIASRPHLSCRSWSIFEDEVLPRATRWLVETVDTEVVHRLQASPPEGDGRSAEETLLALQEEALAAKVKGATESALLAPPAAREAAWALVAQWGEELEATRQRLALVQSIRSGPEFKDFTAWWATVKEGIVYIEATWFEGESPTMRLFVPADRDRLRGLLSRLGFACRVRWRQSSQRPPRYAIQSVEVEGSVDLSARHFIGAPNSNCTHEGIPGTG